MKKKLTINSLAFGNLKKRKKQYVIMIIGIILAMVFSSSVIISIFSLKASQIEMNKNAVGIQDEILVNVTKDIMYEAKKDGYVEEYGFAHMVGYASTDAENEENGFYVAWLDDTAKKLSYQSFIDGAYPTNENEIAIEQSVLERLGIEAEIGDEISLQVFPQSGISHIQNSNSKTYKLVGIVKDKAAGIEKAGNKEMIGFLRNIPSAFVCVGTDTEAGGKESLVSYLTFADFDYPEKIQVEDLVFDNDKNTEFSAYLEEKYNISNSLDQADSNGFSMISMNDLRPYFSFASIEESVIYAGILGVVLSLTSCIAIINSFNSNIKERRQQIGMLRAVGTTRRQIVNLLSREALIISLVSIPVSLVVSYLFVLLLSSFFGEDFILIIDVKSVVVCGIVGLITVMLASLIPIVLATRITPVQAIRNVEVSRKMKTKKIKSQRNFSVPKLLAKRTMAFHKGNQIAVSFLLVSTILFSCLGFSYVSYERTHPRMNGYDYFCSANDDGGITDTDKQNICSATHISRGYGLKTCDINILIDEYTDYFKILAGSDVFDYSYNDDITIENFAEKGLSHYSENYRNIKSQAGYTKDFLPTTLYAVDDWRLEELKEYLVSGEINLDQLASGKEVILIAPQKAGKVITENGRGEISDYTVTDDKITNKFKFAVYDECEYKAGDTIDLSMLYENVDYTETENTYDLEKNDKTVKICAVLKPDSFEKIGNQGVMLWENFGVLTSIAGMNTFSNNLNYEKIFMYVDSEITDEIDDAIISAVEPILYKYQDSYYISDYQENKDVEESGNSMLIAMISLMIIGFAICASLTNNAFTASIRERKRELGTLRAVGISRKEFVECYVRQLLKTFAVGYGAGFALFAAVYLYDTIRVYFKNLKPESIKYFAEAVLDFNPWVTVAFCIILFGICSINLWTKIRKEMKNSIIDNIREL